MRRILVAAFGALLLTFVFAESASAQRAGYRAGGGARHVGAWAAYRPGWRAAAWRRPYAGYGWRYPWRPWAWGAGGVTVASTYGYGYPYGLYPYGGVYTSGYGYPPCNCSAAAYFYPAAAGWGW